MKKLLDDQSGMILENVAEADTFWKRFRGLMFYKSLNQSDGLLINPCKSIHCCFMYFPIDVLFLSDDRRIVYTIEQMKPWSFSPYIRQAQAVLECHPGTIAKYGLRIGRQLHFGLLENEDE